MKKNSFTPLENIFLTKSTQNDRKRNFLTGFTVIELLIALVIIAILLALAIPPYQESVIRSRMPELFTTVDIIYRAEEIFYLEHGFYAAMNDGIVGYDLPYTISQAEIDNFAHILNVDVPGLKSNFVYGVSYDEYNGPSRKLYVAVRGHAWDWRSLCYIPLEGADKGKWFIFDSDPQQWGRYLNPPTQNVTRI